MTEGTATSRRHLILRYTAATGICTIFVAETRVGMPWYWVGFAFCVAFMIVLGQRRIFRPAVSRTADEITCRYNPWYEGNVYVANVLIPLMGVAALVGGNDPDNPPWVRFVGIILVGILPLTLWSAMHLAQRSVLHISPAALTLRLGAPRAPLTEIPRERIESITPKILPTPANGKALQTEIVYHATDSIDGQTTTIVLGLHLTVPPKDLANALVTWHESADEDPNELLDRIEQILRGQSKVDP